MELWSQVSRQRIKHIVSSYRLDGAEAEAFSAYLDELLQRYPRPAVELALVEVLVKHWGRLDLPRGLAFLNETQALLQEWKATTVATRLTPKQFQNITGLDPSPVFGPRLGPPECPSGFPVQPTR